MSTLSSSDPRVAPVVTGVEGLASAAVASLWGALDRILPLWFALSAFFAVHHVAVPNPASDTAVFLQVFDNESWLLTTLVAGAAAASVALRIFLGRGKEALKPDWSLGAFIGIVSLLGVAPAVILMGLRPPALSASWGDMLHDLARSGLGLATGFAMVWLALRLTLWPIGRLLGDRRVTSEQSWILMRGGVASYAAAVLLLTAPMLVLNTLVLTLTAHASPLVRDAAGAPLSAAIVLAAAAVAAEVYRKRLRL